MAKLKVGTPLLVQMDSRQNNGESVAPAVVTRVVDEKENRVNVRVFSDTGADFRYGNVKVVNSEPKDDDDNDERVAWPA